MNDQLKSKVGKIFSNYVFPNDYVVLLKTHIPSEDPDIQFYVSFQSLSEPEFIDEIPVESFLDWYMEHDYF